MMLADAPSTTAHYHETTLDPAIRPTSPPAARNVAHARVLLTGATGFVGAHVLRALLDRGVALVFCLARGADVDNVQARILDGLKRYRLRRPGDASTVRAVRGDLAAPGLGLAPDARSQLAAQVDIVVHAGAWVHLAYPYETLHAANVRGTEEILRFCVMRRTKPVCHVSGMSVFVGSGTMHEDGAPPADADVRNGYFATKWVSERLVWEALDRGVPGFVVRLGWISGDTRAGLIGKADAVTMMIRASARLGIAPRLPNGVIHCTPVDIAARIIVHAALGSPIAARACNLWATHTFHEQEVWRRFAAYGSRIRMVAPEEWLEALKQRFPLIVPVSRSVLSEKRLRPITDANARALVAAAVGRLPAPDDLLDVYTRAWLCDRSAAGTDGRPSR